MEVVAKLALCEGGETWGRAALADTAAAAAVGADEGDDAIEMDRERAVAGDGLAKAVPERADETWI